MASSLVDKISYRMHNLSERTDTCHLIAQLTLAEVNCKTTKKGQWAGTTLLMQAVSHDNRVYFDALLGVAGLDVNMCGQMYSPLYWACYLNKWDLVAILLNQPGINPRLGESPLLEAIHPYCPIAVLEQLITWPGLDLNVNNRGCTLLHQAVKVNLPQVVALLLAQPSFVNINQADEEGRTALMYAATSFQMVSVRLLLAHPDIDVQAVDEHNETALDAVFGWWVMGGMAHLEGVECMALLTPAAFWSPSACWVVLPKEVRQQVGLGWQLTTARLWLALPVELVHLVLTHLASQWTNPALKCFQLPD